MKKATRSYLPVLFYLIFAILFTATCGVFIVFSLFNSKEESINTATTSLKPIVVIDAGHGGEDGGAVGINGCYEKDINLSIAKKLKTYLSSMGIRSVLTRSGDTLLYDRDLDYYGKKKRLDMLERIRITRSYENAIFVSIHQNSFPQEKYKGLQIYYSSSNTESAEIARIIEQEFKQRLQPDNNRTSKASYGEIYLLENLECPALLIECGFISNAEECELLCSDEYQDCLSAVIAVALSKKIASNTSET